MKSKVVKVNHSKFRDRTNQHEIEKQIDKWGKKGYVLQSMQESNLHLSKIFRISNPFHVGHTILVFIKE
jgi:hypothetical protein